MLFDVISILYLLLNIVYEVYYTIELQILVIVILLNIFGIFIKYIKYLINIPMKFYIVKIMKYVLAY